MGKLRKLRTRFISSIGAVRRSVLRRQSQGNSSSTASNPTTLTRLASLDSAIPASTRAAGAGRQAQKRELQVRLQAADGGQENLQLHWNEARRIYSEPVQVTQSTLSRGEGNGVAKGTTETDCTTLPSAADQDELVRCNTGVGGPGSLCGSMHAGSQVSDEEDYDDVFLQSWEETGW